MYDDAGKAVAMDATGNALAAGSFAESVDFGGGLLTSPGGADAFLVNRPLTAQPRPRGRSGPRSIPHRCWAAAARFGSAGLLLLGEGLDGGLEAGCPAP
jgi:hypothetical protein